MQNYSGAMFAAKLKFLIVFKKQRCFEKDFKKTFKKEKKYLHRWLKV
jgi:hypothetical protein